MSRLVQRSKSSFFALPITETGLTTAANTNIAKIPHKEQRRHHIKIGLVLSKGLCQAPVKKDHGMKMMLNCRTTNILWAVWVVESDGDIHL